MTEPVGADFPSLTFHPERVLYRIHRTVNDAIHFASDGLGRFDVMDMEGVGTCYLSPSPIGAYVETLGRLGTIQEQDVEERSLSDLALSRSLLLADLTDRTVLGRYGLSGEMSAGRDYSATRQLASDLHGAGFDGVYYTARHDPAFLERSVAVFGGPGDDKLFVVDTNPIPLELVEQGAREFRLLVLSNYL